MSAIYSDARTGSIKSIQRGTLAVGSGSGTGTATISSVDTAKSRLDLLGVSSDVNGAGSDTQFGDHMVRIALTNATTVTATRFGTPAHILTVSFEVVEYN